MKTLPTSFRYPLLGLPVAHAWKGYGSAIFLEFGTLTPSDKTQRDGGDLNPMGEFGLMIEWSWRVESERKILGGSWSDDAKLLPLITALIGRTVEDVAAFGRLQEIRLAFSGQRYLLSFMTEEGQPEWTIFDRCTPTIRSISSKRGRLVEVAEP
jgi:hypothetical protein